MSRALELARQAALEGEVPVGAVVVLDGRIIGEGRNRREKSRNALSHAELEAIDAACKALNGWRLWQCDLYVTLEPCPMCAGAIINARLRRVIYGTADPKAGSFGSVIDFNSLPYNHKPELTAGVLQGECAGVLSDFFATLRARRKAESATNHKKRTRKHRLAPPCLFLRLTPSGAALHAAQFYICPLISWTLRRP